MHRVYVLQNEAGTFYVGVSEDVVRRLDQHNAGISKWTKGRGPWRMVWSSAPISLGAARKLENHPKRQKGGLGFFHLTGLPKPSPGS